MHWQTGAGPLALEHPLYLGILNLTPDSFSDGGCFLQPEAALGQAQRLVSEGADLLDLGAESTRPGAQSVSEHEEWERLNGALDTLRQLLSRTPLSLDTRHPAVALKGLARGVAVLNDVTGFSDDTMLELARESHCGLIAMRSRQKDGELHMPDYGGPGEKLDVALAELRALRDRLLGAGIDPERVLLDPGFGFGTTFREDQALWEALPELPQRLDWPIERFCLGVSRKRFLAWRAGQPELPPLERDELTHQAHREAERLGYRAFRTHALPAVRVREALPEDAEELGQLLVRSWRAAYRGILPENVLQSLSASEKAAYFRQRLEGPNPCLWVLEGSRLLGFASTEDPGEGPVELQAIYLLPQIWGKGLAQRLLEKAIPEGREALLWVMERNPRARRFYKKTGWQVDGEVRTHSQEGITFREVRYRRKA